MTATARAHRRASWPSMAPSPRDDSSGPRRSTTIRTGTSRPDWPKAIRRERPVAHVSSPAVDRTQRAANGAELGDLQATRAAGRHAPGHRRGAIRRAWPPLIIGVAGLAAWELFVRLKHTCPASCRDPARARHARQGLGNALHPSLLVTLAIYRRGPCSVATVAGVLIAILFTQSRWIELSLFPYAVILQVTPVVAIAPLIIIWVKSIPCAADPRLIVAFFSDRVQHHARPSTARRPQLVVNLFQLTAPPAPGVLVPEAPQRDAPTPWAVRASQRRLRSGAVVAEFVAGAGGARVGASLPGPGIRSCTMNRAMFAPSLMTRAPAFSSFVGLTVLSHLALRTARERGRARGMR